MKIKTIASVLLVITALGLTALFNANGSATGINAAASPTYPTFGVEIPGSYEVHGIDVSRHQRDINWEAVRKMRHEDIELSFAFIKASEGRTVVDQYFKSNWKKAKDAGMLRGAYHFFRPHLTADEQASLFFKMVPKLEVGDLPPVLDIEMRGSCPPARLKRNLKRWLVLTEQKYGITPIIYTNYGFYKNYLTGKEFKKYPLWIAHYKTADLNVKLSNWHFWQHSDRGRVDGIRGTVDFNVFKGQQDEILQLCKK